MTRDVAVCLLLLFALITAAFPPVNRVTAVVLAVVFIAALIVSVVGGP